MAVWFEDKKESWNILSISGLGIIRNLTDSNWKSTQVW